LPRGRRLACESNSASKAAAYRQLDCKLCVQNDAALCPLLTESFGQSPRKELNYFSVFTGIFTKQKLSRRDVVSPITSLRTLFFPVRRTNRDVK
jgi:hypothetical protein